MSGLPQGWVEINLAETGSWCSGGTPSRRRSDYFGKGIPWVKSGDLPDGLIEKSEEEITEIGLNNSSAKLLPAGTISMALYGATIGKLGIMAFPAATNQACANVVPNKHLIEPYYLFFYLLSQRQTFIELGQGGAQPNISQEIVRKHPFPLPPLNEQRRIVAKLEALLSRVDACQQRLARIPVILKRFRQAVLAAACSGRLTTDWREKQGIGEGDELPKGWTTYLFEKLLLELKNGISPRPNIDPPGIPILRISSTRGGNVDISDTRYVLDGEKYIPVYALNDKDLLFTRYNGTLDLLGVCGMVRGLGGKNLLYPDKLMRVRVNGDLIFPEYVEIYFQAPSVREKVIEKAKSSAGQNGISGKDIKELLVALPPLSEQQEIVRRVEALFKLADRLEARYTTAQVQVDKLTQSILAKAFRGELVPQDPSDEPAEKLLERIREQRAASTVSKTKQKRGGKKQPGLSPSAQPDFAVRINQRFAGLDADKLPIPERQAVQQ